MATTVFVNKRFCFIKLPPVSADCMLFKDTVYGERVPRHLKSFRESFQEADSKLISSISGQYCLIDKARVSKSPLKALYKSDMLII